MEKCPSCEAGQVTRIVTAMTLKVDKARFDAVLGKLIATQPEKREDVRPERKPKKVPKSSVRASRKA